VVIGGAHNWQNVARSHTRLCKWEGRVSFTFVKHFLTGYSLLATPVLMSSIYDFKGGLLLSQIVSTCLRGRYFCPCWLVEVVEQFIMRVAVTPLFSQGEVMQLLHSALQGENALITVMPKAEG
jgi:hypothetical protein